MTEDDHKKADDTLMNWGRFVRDDWLDHNLLIDPPPTSSGYLAPVVAYDETEPARMPTDEQDAALSEHVIVSIGLECGGFGHHQALVSWYTRLIFHECTTDERYKRLAKRLHCNYDTAPELLKMARATFWDRKKVIDALFKITTCKLRKIG